MSAHDRIARARSRLQVAAQNVAPGSITINGVPYVCAAVATPTNTVTAAGGIVQKRQLFCQIRTELLAESVFRNLDLASHPIRRILILHETITYRLTSALTDGHNVFHHLVAEEDSVA